MAEAKKVAYVFPGQGAQAVGMGHDLYDSYPTAGVIFEQADEALGFPLSQICFEGPEDELLKTINTQPALVTVSFACLKVAQETGKGLPPPTLVAGHSLGEYTALAVANVLDFADAVRLARERGRLMYEAGLQQPGTMAAIIGLDEPVLAEICQQTDTCIANINCPGQLVISGGTDNVERAVELAKEKGASRTIPLQVSGAFHSPLMQPAVDGMAEILPTVAFRDPTVPVVANVTAQPLTTGEAVRAELLDQLRNGVQWQGSVEYMLSQGVTSIIEIGPGRVLTGLMRRIDRDTETMNISNADDIKALAEQG
ncbi:MAG: ACP S-malonyltransferase [Dehalococcoidales bacterium]|nr:MAG: ACP S-malonyltransferase [Dehalococcoidales bacterium]